MHAVALCSLLVTNGIIMPPVLKYKGEILKAESAVKAIEEFENKHRLLPAIIGGPTKPGSLPWDDDGNFPCKAKLDWYYATWGKKWSDVISPESLPITLSVIDCGTEELAKQYFLECRLRRVPYYARSGRFLIKANKEAFEWFASHYGAERYFVSPQEKPKAK
jgi:hypothetical protein